MTVTLVLGGARSGKSAYAERRAIESGREIVYIATARAGDAEMADRIDHHRRQRPRQWRTVEEPLWLAAAIEEHANESTLVLVDCLTLWLSNVLFAKGEHYPETGPIALPKLFVDERTALLAALRDAGGDVILVSNEIGMGIVPMGAATRLFMDQAGRLNQAIAAASGETIFVAAGLPLVLKARPCSRV